jgi:hypothetical protein
MSKELIEESRAIVGAFRIAKQRYQCNGFVPSRTLGYGLQTAAELSARLRRVAPQKLATFDEGQIVVELLPKTFLMRNAVPAQVIANGKNHMTSIFYPIPSVPLSPEFSERGKMLNSL